MTIRDYLRSLGITRYEFANMLQVSLPTVDTYISFYEDGRRIPKYKYQHLFRELFDNPVNDRELFKEKIEKYLYFYDLKKPIEANEENEIKKEKYKSIVESLSKDIEKDGWSESIYTFMNIMINNYRNNTDFATIADYFLYFNGFKELKNITDIEKSFYGKLYKTFYDHVYGENTSRKNLYYYEEYKRKCDENRSIREEKKNMSKKEMNKEISNIINDLEANGIEITMENIVNAIKNK